MDKVVFKDLMAQRGLPQVALRGVPMRDWRRDPTRSLERRRARLPVFVKPARLGSSVGIVEVDGADELRRRSTRRSTTTRA